MWYAIRNKTTGNYVAGTDFNHPFPHYEHTLADEYHAPKLFTQHNVFSEFLTRAMNPEKFEIVKVAVLCFPCDIEWPERESDA